MTTYLLSTLYAPSNWPAVQTAWDAIRGVFPIESRMITDKIEQVTRPLFAAISSRLSQISKLSEPIPKEWNDFLKVQSENLSDISRWEKNETTSLDDVQYNGIGSVLGLVPFTGWIHAFRFSVMNEALKIYYKTHPEKMTAQRYAASVKECVGRLQITTDQSILTDIGIDVADYLSPQENKTVPVLTYKDLAIIGTKLVASTAWQWGLRYCFVSGMTHALFLQYLLPEPLNTLLPILALMGYGNWIVDSIKYDLYRNIVDGPQLAPLSKNQKDRIIEIVKVFNQDENLLKSLHKELDTLKPKALDSKLQNPISQKVISAKEPEVEKIEKKSTEPKEEIKEKKPSNSEEKQGPHNAPSSEKPEKQGIEQEEIKLKSKEELLKEELKLKPNEEALKELESLDPAYNLSFADTKTAIEMRGDEKELKKKLDSLPDDEKELTDLVVKCAAGVWRANDKKAMDLVSKFFEGQVKCTCHIFELKNRKDLINVFIEAKIQEFTEKYKDKYKESKAIELINTLKMLQQ